MFDTNVYVSALVIPGSLAEKAILRVLEGKDQAFISKEILDELLKVLARKFSRDAGELARVALWISDCTHLVRPKRRFHVLKDDADNRILECASEAKVDAIVTGDKEMLALGEFEGIRIVSLREYLMLEE